MNKTSFFLSSSEWHGQTVCEVKVEKEANNFMQFPLTENWSLSPEPFIQSHSRWPTKCQRLLKCSPLYKELPAYDTFPGKMLYLSITSIVLYFTFQEDNLDRSDLQYVLPHNAEGQ